MKDKNLLRFCKRSLQSPEQLRRPYSTICHKDMAVKAYYGVVTFYVVNLFWAYQTLYIFMDRYAQPQAAGLAVEPFWPVFFITSSNLPLSASAISLFYMASSLLVVLWPQSRLCRCLVWVAIMQATALKYSFGVLNEKEQWWMWISFIFIFLPNAAYSGIMTSLRQRQYYLDIFGLAQGMLLLMYSLVGLWKFYYGFVALFSHNGFGIFSPDALAYITTDRVINNHGPAFMGSFVIDHPVISEVSFIALSYVELFALAIWLRPSLHRLWGVVLILLHVGTWLFMNIVFYFQPPLLAIFLLHSPFIPETPSWGVAFRQLPLVHSSRRLVRHMVRRYA